MAAVDRLKAQFCHSAALCFWDQSVVLIALGCKNCIRFEKNTQVVSLNMFWIVGFNSFMANQSLKPRRKPQYCGATVRAAVASNSSTVCHPDLFMGFANGTNHLQRWRSYQCCKTSIRYWRSRARPAL